MHKQRIDRLNSLLKEVISEVIRKDVHNPHVTGLVTITRCEITKDLHYAKVFVSVIGSEPQKAETLAALQSAAQFIAVTSSKKVTLRYFPSLTFFLDVGLHHQMRVEEILHKIKEEQKSRPVRDEDDAETGS